jgi:hypothetical protein
MFVGVMSVAHSVFAKIDLQTVNDASYFNQDDMGSFFEHLTLYQANTSNDLATPRQDLLRKRVCFLPNNFCLGKISCQGNLDKSCLVKKSLKYKKSVFFLPP